MRKRGWYGAPFWLESWSVVIWTFTDAQTRRATCARAIDGLNVYSCTIYRYVREGATLQRFSWRRRVTEYYTFLGICSHFGQIGSSTYESNAEQMDVLPDTGHWNMKCSWKCCSSSSGSSICDLDGPSARRGTWIPSRFMTQAQRDSVPPTFSHGGTIDGSWLLAKSVRKQHPKVLYLRWWTRLRD